MAIKGFEKWHCTKTLWPSILYLIICTGTVCPDDIWPLQLIQAFQLYLACLSVVLIWHAGRNESLFAIVPILSATALILSSANPYLPWKSIEKGGQTEITTGVFNLYHHNSEFEQGVSAILGTRCDFMAVLEVSEVWDSVLSCGLTDLYPYAVRVPHPECCYGISVYSKLPFEADTVLHFTRDPVIRVTLNIRGQATDLWAVHTRPPIFPNDTDERNMLMALVAAEIKKRDRPAILVGDLNIVPWAQDFKRMAETAELSDSRRGYLATYPMDLGIPLIPIDHILHTTEFSTAFCETVSIPGSDHKGLTAGLSTN